ncbi:hypothetical protein J4426_00880 [Candidatus Woesearchaeota archaeon]|nr:hypothetical protein [Candidatus Woesearchaeota archaeon]
MRKGIGQYPMFVYGLIILVLTLILALILFGPRLDFSFSPEKNEGYGSLDINLMNYLRTPVIIENLKFSMMDLIAYSFSNNDFTLLQERTENIFKLAYQDECLWDISFELEGDKKSFSNLNEVNFKGERAEFDSAIAVIPTLDGKAINVRLKEIC